MKKIIQNRFVYLFLLCFLVMLLAACSKDESLGNKPDQYTEQEEKLNTLTLSVSAVGKNFIEFSWEKITSSHFNPVSYMIYLDGKLVAKDVSITKYSVINLKEDKNYNIMVQAISSSGLKVEKSSTIQTLGGNKDDNMYYKEYKIHTQSRLTNPSIARLLDDGGHLICSYLQHDNIATQDYFKVIVYRTDMQGEILWYRLIADLEYFGKPFEFILSDKKENALLLVGRDLYAIDANKGTLLNEKPITLQTIPTEDYFTAAKFNAQGEIIIGTALGNLLKINKDDYQVVWKRKHSDYPIKAIEFDNAGKIYYCFDNFHNSDIQIQKTDSEGSLLNTFKFDGKYPGYEADHLYLMSSLIKDNDDNFYLWGYDLFYYNLRYFKFDINGKILSKTKQAVNLIPKGAFFDNDNNLVVYGQEDGSGISTYGTINKYDKNLKVLSSKQYPELPMHRFMTVTQNKDNSYNLFFYYQQTWSLNNLNFIYIKTKSNGQLY